MAIRPRMTVKMAMTHCHNRAAGEEVGNLDLFRSVSLTGAVFPAKTHLAGLDNRLAAANTLPVIHENACASGITR